MDENKSTPVVIPAAPYTESFPNPETVEGELFIRYLLGAVPFILLSVLILLIWRRHRTVLYNARDLMNPEIKPLRIELGRLATRLFIRSGHDSRQIANLRHGRARSNRLNARLTVEATVKNSGIPDPVWRHRRPLIQWLVVIQSFGRNDQIGAYGEVLCKELNSNGLESHWLSFRNQPAPLYREGQIDRQVRSLAALKT